MRQEGALWLDTLDHFEGLCDGVMRRMRAVTQRVEYKHIEVLEQREGFLGNAAAVGEVGKRAETEAEDRSLSVKNGDRLDPQLRDVERTLDGVKLNLRRAAALLFRRIENVVEVASEVFG